jgi:hypothetical protein
MEAIMGEVERFDLGYTEFFHGLVKNPNGAYVRYSDYATLQVRLSELEAVTLERAARVAAGPAEAWGEFPGGTPERDRIAAAILALKGGAR